MTNRCWGGFRTIVRIIYQKEEPRDEVDVAGLERVDEGPDLA